MSEDKKPKKVIFEPGCFDAMDFESQEELDSFVKEITDMFENMSPEDLMAQSRPVDMEALLEEDPEMARALLAQLAQLESQEPKKLH